MALKKERLNNFNLCTLDVDSNCENCTNNGHLSCKFDESIKNNFRIIGFPPILLPMLGMILLGLTNGMWWPLVVYTLYFVLMFTVFEIRFLCSHCPYYPDGRKTLTCLGNHGSPKLWKYHPEPMNKFEKFMMTFGTVGMIFYVMPLLALGYGIYFLFVNLSVFGTLPLIIMIGLAFLSFLLSSSFVSTLKTFYCNKCINFSCPLNTVPKKVVDQYLVKNSAMREAWEKTGYKIEKSD